MARHQRPVDPLTGLGLALGNLVDRQDEVGIVAACRGRPRRVVACRGRIVEHVSIVAGKEYVWPVIRRLSMRRTDADKMRRTISELLDQLYAVEHSMEIFNRKADGAELERAAEHFNDMLGHVDQLGEMIAQARAKNRTQAAA